MKRLRGGQNEAESSKFPNFVPFDSNSISSELILIGLGESCVPSPSYSTR